MKHAKIYMVCSAALILGACGDSSTASSPEQGETATSITCNDGTIVESMDQCYVENSGVAEQKTMYQCNDGQMVEDAALCPAGEPVQTVTTVTCKDGSVVNDAALCPAVITCSDGKEVKDPGECGTVTEVPASSATTAQNSDQGDQGNTGILGNQGDQGNNPANPTENTATSSSSLSNTLAPSCASNGDNNPPPVSPFGNNSEDTEEDDNVNLKGDETTLTFAGTDVTIANDNGCLKKETGSVTISCSGNYYLSGTASDYQVIVNVASNDTGKVDLFLNDVSLKSSDAPIYVQNAEKAELHLVKGTTNSVEDGASRAKTFTYTTNNGQKVDTTNAAIYAKDDLSFKGSGSLTVKGNYNNGIQTSKDVKFKKSVGTLTVNAKNHGIKGKGSVTINGGNIDVITTEGDGIKSDEDDATRYAEGKGNVKINGGNITIKSAFDGISAANAVQIQKGENIESEPVIKVTSGGGQSCLTTSTLQGGNGGGGRGGMGGFGGFGMEGNSCQEETSKKGIKGDSSIVVTAGTIDVSSRDDGFHSNGDITLSGGKITVKSDDDGVHADNALYVKDNVNIEVTLAYEGMEAYEMHFDGGITSVTTTDDGWNAAGGTDNSGVENNGGGWGGGGGRGGPGGFGGFGGGSTGKLYVTGGVHYVKTGSGDTDGVDSNGSIDITGGVLVIECLMNGGMGGMMDSDGQTNITGGMVLGFGVGRSEAGTNYSVSYNTNGYYGIAGKIAFKPTITGSYTISNQGQPAAVNGTDGLTKTCFGSSTTNCVYYSK